jgi:hypothetical protein
MWWDVFVPKTVMEARLHQVTEELSQQIARDAAEITLLRGRLHEIEGSAGWKFVLWARRLFARLFPASGVRGKFNRLGRRAVHVWLDRGTLFATWAGSRKVGKFFLKRLRWQREPAAAQVPAPPALPSYLANGHHPAPALETARNGPTRWERDLFRGRPTVGPRARKRFGVYTSSLGNYFFHEMRDLLIAGLEELGYEAHPRNEIDGLASGDDWRVIIAPHEFFYLGAGRELAETSLPDNLVVVNTEQPSTQWFQLAARFFPSAHALWDIDYLSSQRLYYEGWQCRYLPLGYIPGFKPLRKLRDLPAHSGTCFLEPEVQHRSPLVEPLAVRPIDVIFFGNPTARRQAFYTAAAPVLARYRCYLHFSDSAKPLLSGRTTCMDTPTVMGLVQRAKILLNIHRDEDLYFEWQRIVLQGMWQRTLVISEPCSPAPPFRPNIEYVEASLAEIPAKIDYYLSDPRGRAEAQAVANEGFRTLSRDCPMREVLAPLVSPLAVPSPAGLNADLFAPSGRAAA